MAKPAQILYRLQLRDLELGEQLSKLSKAESLLGESKELRSARTAVNRAVQECDKCRARIRELELETESVKARMASTGDRLYGGQVNNPKELAGLEKDLGNSRRARAQLEDQLLTAMVHLDECEQTLGDAKGRLEAEEKVWAEEQERVGKQIEQLRGKVAQLQAERTALASSVGPSDLAAYEELRRKNRGRAVALLVDNSMCQGCRVTLSASRAQLVRKSSELVTCTNCGCILAEP